MKRDDPLISEHATLKLWLRLLSCSTQMEAEIRRRLRSRFGISLGRFDYLAALHRHPAGLKMSELSRHLRVTGGNVTGLTDDLEREGLVVRDSIPSDRRAWMLRLTTRGRRAFETMAREHEQWVRELFGGLDEHAVSELYAHLGVLRAHLKHDTEEQT
jgi:DNA-binding MarR family transcriptional regulator